MTHRLRWHSLSKQSGQCLFMILTVLMSLLWTGQAFAQTLDTEPLAVTSVCPGAQLDVTALRTSATGDFTVQLSDGGTTYTDIPSFFLSSSGRYEVTYRATIPASTSAGSTYRIRVVSKNPDITGTPSPTILTVKARPAPPTVEAIMVDCQRVLPGSDVSSTISATVSPGASARLYDDKLTLQNNSSINLGGQARGFTVPKEYIVNGSAYTYPVKETTFYVTQLLNECESDQAKTVLRILYRPVTGPKPVNAVPQEINISGWPLTYYGTVGYCQGDKAGSLAVNGHSAPPENYQVVYKLLGDNQTTTTAPTPNTSLPSTQTYELALVPIDPTKGCSNYSALNTRLTVTVNARPGKPTVATTSISLCQSQSASPLSATTTDASASLVWYGTSVTAGTGTSAPTQPSTANAGTFKYYVAQKLGGCESDRAEIVVEVKPTPAAPTVQSVAVCQNAPAPVLQPTGQNLLWYANSSGGTGSATTPVVSTSQTSQTTYYVSQSLSGCESTRATFSVTVSAIPGVPTVANTGPAYCQNVAASPLAATGQGLNWYRESSGGTSLGSTVTPDTKNVGSFTYYVSQTINGCEGSRSSLTVTVTASPSAPTVTSAYSYCQKIAVSSLTATGTALKWYDASGNSLNAAPTPSTDAPGTIRYFVTQTTDNCESPRAEINVTTKPTPTAPATAALSVCQNTPTQSLSANGQNLRWYTTETGSTSTPVSPTISTSQAGQTNYYVSQNLDGCESSRSLLTVVVKLTPSAPGVTQKTSCQFAPSEPVTAIGQGLTWYNTDGTKAGSTPVINTDKGGSFTVLVTQAVDGCEGPKATLIVTVLATPAPTVSKTTVEVCQGATAQSLSATGTALKWTDPNGNVTTTAPTPPTLNATTNTDGDVYYVTQTVDGCESSKVAIRVFIQTPPTLSILGTTTVNLGLEVPLKLTFTGVGPYRYKLSNGLTGTATKDTTILVLPTQTTVYQVAEVTNNCGAGLPGSGGATVTVLVPTIQTLPFISTTLCAGASLTTNFLTSGTFNSGNVFKLQLARVETDTTKISFVDALNSQASNGQISGIIPANATGGFYLVRVIATNPKIPINGTVSLTRLTVRPLAAATLTGNQTVYEGQPASLSVVFSGDGPWNFAYRDSTATGLGSIQSVVANANPYAFEVRPKKTTAYFLTSVSNGCGNGLLTARVVVVTVNPLLGIDDQSLADAVEVYPVPATTTLTVRIRGLSPRQTALLEIIDPMGHTTSRQETRQATSSLLLDQHPAGTYVLRIRVGGRTVSKRIVKL